jgi:hypothetical protein
MRPFYCTELGSGSWRELVTNFEIWDSVASQQTKDVERDDGDNDDYAKAQELRTFTSTLNQILRLDLVEIGDGV